MATGSTRRHRPLADLSRGGTFSSEPDVITTPLAALHTPIRSPSPDQTLLGDPPVIGTARAIFTAPWDPVATHRGDALGLRALPDVFADLVAPEMNYRINDARWLTILAWCFEAVKRRVSQERGPWR